MSNLCKWYKYKENNKYIVYNNDFGFLLFFDDNITKIWDTATICMDESLVDNYMESRGFENVLDFDKLTITWYNDYDKEPKLKPLKLMLSNLVHNILKRDQELYGDNRNKYYPLYIQAQILVKRI